MSDTFQDLFQKALLQEAEGDDVFRSRRDPEAFESGLDSGTDPSDFDVEGMGFDATAQQEDRFVDAYQRVSMLTNTISELIDPDSGTGSLLKLLAELDRSDSIAKGVADRIRKDAKKAADSLSSIINELKTVASMEPSLRRKIEQINSN